MQCSGQTSNSGCAWPSQRLALWGPHSISPSSTRSLSTHLKPGTWQAWGTEQKQTQNPPSSRGAYILIFDNWPLSTTRLMWGTCSKNSGLNVFFKITLLRSRKANIHSLKDNTVQWIGEVRGHRVCRSKEKETRETFPEGQSSLSHGITGLNVISERGPTPTPGQVTEQAECHESSVPGAGPRGSQLEHI